MGLLGTLKETLAASNSTPNASERGTGSGAYWCTDCSERIPAAEVDGEATPDCPSCGDAMELERSPSSTGCAC